MKARRRISIHDSDIPRLSFHCQAITSPNKFADAAVADDNVEQEPTPPATPANETAEDEAVGPADNAEKPEAQQKGTPQAHRDPIKWFGILVPPSLRTCQNSFDAVIRGPVMEAATAGRAMRQVEAEIRRVRKDIRKAEKADVNSGDR